MNLKAIFCLFDNTICPNPGPGTFIIKEQSRRVGRKRVNAKGYASHFGNPLVILTESMNHNELNLSYLRNKRTVERHMAVHLKNQAPGSLVIEVIMQQQRHPLITLLGTIPSRSCQYSCATAPCSEL